MPAPPPSAAPTYTAPPQPSTRRSQTMPTMTPDVKLPTTAKARPSLTVDARRAAETDIDDTKSSICLSPSWDQGKKAKREKRQREKEEKKQEEARKEAEKKARKEAEKQQAAANKAGKREGRLSKKPPPAAMDTQRMPSALRPQPDSRRNSILSVFSSGPSSGDSSRRSSRDLKRLSVASTASSNGQRRSHSTPATSTEIGDSSSAWRSLVSGTAPQLPALPRFGLHSRNGSSGESKSNSWGSEEAYSRELAKSANQLSTSPRQASFVGDSIQSLKQARPLVRSQTDTALMTIGQVQPVIKEVPRAVAERTRSRDAYQNSRSDPQGSLQYLGNHRIKNSGVDQDSSDDVHVATNYRSGVQHAQYLTVHPLQANPIQIASSLDGGSYVHKERMRKQQQSLRGFQDEQAVKDATKTLREEDENLPQEQVVTAPEGQETTISDHKAADVPPVPPVSKVRVPEPIVKSVDQYHGYPKESPEPSESVVLCNPDSMPAKRHTFLGLGFRSKPLDQPRQSFMAENVARSSENTDHPKPQMAPRLDTRNMKDSARLSKTERILGHAPPQTPPSETPLERSRLSQAVVDKERSPTGKSNSPTHGRTKLANAIVDKESPPRKKDQSPVQARASPAHDGVSKETQVQEPQMVRSHSRTRTSSSQLLNDNVSLPRSLPRSTTAPVLPSFDHEPFFLSQGEAANSTPAKIHVHAPTNQKELTDYTKFQLAVAAKPLPQPPRSSELAQNESEPKRVPELVIESATPEGIVRKTSLKRPRSNPQLQVTTPNPPVPSLDFLPQLKHQALVKPKPRSHLRNSVVPTDEITRPSSSQFPVPAAPMHNALTPANNSAPNLTMTAPRSPKRPSSQLGPRSHTSDALDPGRPNGPPNRMSTGGRPAGLGKTVAKLIVTCCSCTRWIDLPSDLFEAMAMPARLTKLDGSAAGTGEARLDTAVQCPWCAHCMTTHCCSTDTWVCNKHNGFL